jgi:hypothetical protein
MDNEVQQLVHFGLELMLAHNVCLLADLADLPGSESALQEARPAVA